MKTNSAPTLPLLPFAPISPHTALWSVLTGLALVLPALHVIHLLPLPPAVGQEEAALARIAGLSVWALAFKAMIMMPLIEECVYRGVVLQMLRRRLPLWLALIPPTFMFGITHWGFSIQNAIFASLVGLHFAWLVIRTRSLFASILCHGSVNGFFLFILRPVFGGSGTTADTLYQPALLLLSAISVAVLAYGINQLRDKPGSVTAVPVPA